LPAHGVGFTRQQRFIHFEVVSLKGDAVGDDGVARAQQDAISEDDVVSRKLAYLAVANHTDGGLVQDG
jgi:hypothetical protein